MGQNVKRQPGPWSSPALPALVAVAVVASACASRSGAVPRPFPGAPVVSRTPPSPAPPAVAAPTAVDGAVPAGFEASTLIATALSLRGAPYRNGGSNPEGFDCSGFTQYVFAHHGVAIPRDTEAQFEVGDAITDEAIEAGDLLFFSTTDSGPSHVAIAISLDEFVHAPSSRGVVRVERRSLPYWSERFLGARRVQAARN